jgi:recombination protein RecA
MAKASPRPGSFWISGVKAGVVEKSGAWFSYGDERIGQGRENAKQFLKDNPDVAFAIEDKIRAAHGLDFHATDDDGAEMLED